METYYSTYLQKTLISNISETHRFSPQMRLIAYPDHKTTLRSDGETGQPVLYRGLNAAEVFLKKLEQTENEMKEFFSNPQPIQITLEDLENYEKSNTLLNLQQQQKKKKKKKKTLS